MFKRDYVVGAIYHSAYWDYDYKVRAVNGSVVTVQLVKPSSNNLTHNDVGEIWSHYTPLDERDRVVSLPGIGSA